MSTSEPAYIVRLTESERRQLLVLIQEDRDWAANDLENRADEYSPRDRINLRLGHDALCRIHRAVEAAEKEVVLPEFLRN